MRNQTGSAFGRLCKGVLKAISWTLVGAFGVLLLWAYEARSLPDLQPWHRARFTQEFDAAKTSRTTD